MRTRRTFGDVLKACGAFLALAALVAGVPAALAYFIGWPLPHRMPTLDMLRDEVSAGVFIDVLTVVVWLAWAQFTACVLVEVKGALSGVGLPARVPGAGPSQLLARQLVTAVLLLGSTTASFAPGLAQLGHHVQPHQPAQTVASAQLLPGQQQSAGDDALPGGGSAHVMGGSSSDTVVPAAAGGKGDGAGRQSAGDSTDRAARTKFYRIQPPAGRHHDSLWEIAERHLDDGRRYKEIYRLNKDRVQPDGSRLSEASLIRPGWIMEMPADAHGGELVEMPDDAQQLGERERAQFERYQDSGSGRDAGGGHGDRRQQSPQRDEDRSAQDEPTAPDRSDNDTPGTDKPGGDGPGSGVPGGDAPGGDTSEQGTPDRDADPVPDSSDSDDGTRDDDSDPELQPSVPDDPAATKPDQQVPDDGGDPGGQPPGDRDTPADRDADGPGTDADDGTGADTDDTRARPDTEERLDVPPDAHSPDRQGQSVPETPAEREPTRTDDLGDSADDDGLPGPGVPQPDDIRPGGTPGTSHDSVPGGDDRHAADRDRGGAQDHDRGGEGRTGTGDRAEDDTAADLDHAGIPEADRSNRLDSSGAARDEAGGDTGDGVLGPVGLPEALLGAPLLAAGVLAALGRRRRTALWKAVTGRSRRATGDDFTPPSDPAALARDALLAGADPGAVRFLDRALRGLAEDLAEAGRTLPVVYAAWLTGQDLHLQLAEEAGQPPAPWRFGQSPAFWTIQRSHTRFDVDTSGPPPYPALVSLGLRGEARLLLNLESVPGLVSVAGEEERRTAVLASVAAELATGSWSQGTGVTLVGFGEELRALAPDRVRHLPDVAALLREREAARAGGPAASGAQAAPQLVLVGAEPTEEEAHRLAALATERGGPRVGFVVGVTGGRLPSAVWEFTVDAEGTLAAPRMGLQVRAQLLPGELRTAVVELFADADGERSEGGRGPGFRVDLSEGGRPAVYARIMGSYDVTGIEPPEEARSALLHEALALLLLNRDGVHPRVLASALWPKGVTDDVRDALVERLRGWLGIETDGTPRLSTDKDGRLALRPSVVSDWDVLRTLHHGCTGDRGTRLAAQVRRQKLTEALDLARGPLLSDRPQGRYGWLAHDAVEAQHPLLVAEVGLALCAEHLRSGEPGAAVDAVYAALRSASADERLWDALLRAAYDTGEQAVFDEAVRWVTERAAALHGAERGLPPRTRALLEELAPGACPR
ncbi:BTAD domain-containing putative transcriptional regulator [Streptomyces sp. NPDC006990]|uniref:BTAD domain-containing putative transcriptional regulator n=1 Tax=unclassified Streptomyces TaxID=2593676 RepID=UPI003455571B